MKRLDGVRVAITGGTRGLGLALVEALRERGADVAFVARQARRVSEIARRLPGTHGITGDVSVVRQQGRAPAPQPHLGRGVASARR